MITHVAENHLARQLAGGPLLVLRDVAADDLHQVVEQAAQGELKDRALGRGADEFLEMEHFGDLLEHAFSLPIIMPPKRVFVAS